MTGQTLTPFPALTSPITPAQAKTLSANVAQIQNLDNREVLAFEVVSLIYELNAKGGTNYVSNHPQLRTDVTSFMGVFSIIQFSTGSSSIRHMQAVIAWNAAYAATTAIGTDVQAIIVAMKGERETPESVLWQYIIYLRYCLSILAV
jgi:hypothetical protein